MNENKKKKTGAFKHTLALGGAFFATFGVTAAAVFFMLPQKTITNKVDGNKPNGGDGGNVQSNAQRFVNQLLSTATSGLTLDVNDLEFVIPGAVKSVDGQQVTTENRISNIEGKNPQIAFALNGLSLSGINLSAKLPLQYNGLKRELNLGLLGDGEVDKNLYFNIGDIDGDQGDWTAGYQVDVKRYVTEEKDPVTGGTISYEYGKLDFVIHDIIEILTEGGINIDTYGKIGALLGGGSASASSASSFDVGAMLGALDAIEESTFEGNSYFTLNLPLGGIEFSIGLGADANFNLSRVDIPSKTSGKQNQPVSAHNDWTLALSANVYTKGHPGAYDWTVPEEWKAYPRLDDSLDLFRRIASLVATPKFGVDLDVDMYHKTDAKEGTITSFGKKGVEEKARLSVNGDVDLAWKLNNGAIQGVDFNSAGAEVTFQQFDKNESGDWGEGKTKQMLSAYIDNGNKSNASVYLNVANALKARTTKTTLDEMIGKFRSTVPSNPVQAAAEKKTNAQLDAIVDQITNVIGILQGQKNFETPALLQGLKEQHYEAVLEMIENVEIRDNLIGITLSLDGLGFAGAKVSLQLDGDALHSLATLRVENLKLQTLALDVTLKTDDHLAKTPEELQAMNAWSEMNKLPTLVDPIANIVKNKQASLALSGSVAQRGTMDVYQDPSKMQGMEIRGNVNLDFSKPKGQGGTNPFLLQGGVDLTLVEKAATYYQDHHIKIDIANAEDSFASLDNQLYLHYDSMNGESAQAELEQRDQPLDLDGINGKIHLSSAADALASLLGAASNSDDRFSRISRLFAAPAEASFLSELSAGNYFSAIAGYDILKSATIGEDVDTFVLNGSALGMDGDLTLSLHFSNAGEGKAFDYAKIALSQGKDPSTATDISFKIAFEEVTASTKFAFLDHAKEYDDFTGLATLGDYAVSTALLGLENGQGVSTYALEGSVNLALGDYEAELVRAKMQASVEGAQVKMHAELNDMPVIRGLNAPDDPRYFREFEIGGQRDASFYYYSDGREDESGKLTTELLMTRHSDYGRLANVNDSVKLNEEGAFSADALSYLLQYFLGVDESHFAAPQNAISAAQAPAKRALAIHAEDLFKSFEKTVDEQAKTVAFTVKLNLNPLLGVRILDDLTLRIEGGTFGGFKALNAIRLDAGVSLFGSQGGRINLVRASVDLALTNLVAGQYLDGWKEGQAAFEQNFLRFTGKGDYVPVGIYAEKTDVEGGAAWRHGVDPQNAGHRNYYLGLSK